MPARPLARHRAPRDRVARRDLVPRHRRLGIACGAALVPVMVLAAVYITGGAGAPRLGHGRGERATPAPTLAAGHPAAGTASSAAGLGTADPQRAARRGHGEARAHPPATTGPAEPSRPTPGRPAASTPAPPQQVTAAGQVLALINQARAQAGLVPYALSAGLDSSARAHTARMAAGCGLSHQCPREPPLGTRETKAGVSWTSAGENIGEGGPVADTTAAIAQMAVDLTQDMLNEKPPDDGHRLNILSSQFQIIGIAVHRDSSGTVWMTQDFAN